MGDNPEIYDLAHLPDKLRQALEYWKSLKGTRAIPLRSSFDPIDVPALLPHFLMVEVLRCTGDREVRDFRFRLVGTYIDDRVKERYTGKRLSEIEGKGPGSALWRAYGEVERERKPKLLSLNYLGPTDGIKKSWEVFLPFSNSGTRVDFILVLIEFA